jgi:Thiol-activated cytolysin.
MSGKIINVGLLFLFLTSCERSDFEKMTRSFVDQSDRVDKSVKGRFDDTPFKWDVIHSSNSRTSDVFVGSYSLSTSFSQYSEDNSFKNKSINGLSSSILVLNPIGMYVGAAYPSSSLDKATFDKEIVLNKNTVRLIYDFSNPFLDTVENIRLFEFKESFKRALGSSEFIQHEHAGRENIDYFVAEYRSTSDIEKSFEGNPSLGKVFSSMVEKSSKKTNVNGRLIARIIVSNFNVVLDSTNSSGFFLDAKYNAKEGWDEDVKPVYINSITYGKVAFLAIESEYPFSDVKNAFEVSVNYKPDDSNIQLVQKAQEVFSQSSITILAVNDDTGDINFSNDIETINKFMSLNSNSFSYGVPIYYSGRYVFDNSIFVPTIGNSSNDRRPNNEDGGVVKGPRFVELGPNRREPRSSRSSVERGEDNTKDRRELYKRGGR